MGLHSVLNFRIQKSNFVPGSCDCEFLLTPLKSLVLFVEKCLVILGQDLTGRLDAPVVFAHNDLLSGNLMLNDDEGIHVLPLDYM